MKDESNSRHRYDTMRSIIGDEKNKEITNIRHVIRMWHICLLWVNEWI